MHLTIHYKHYPIRNPIEKAKPLIQGISFIYKLLNATPAVPWTPDSTHSVQVPIKPHNSVKTYLVRYICDTVASVRVYKSNLKQKHTSA